MPAWTAATASGDSGRVRSRPSTSAARQGPTWRSPTDMGRYLPSRIHVVVDLARIRVRRGQRVLHAVVDLRLHVGGDALEDAGVGELLSGQPAGQRQQRIVLGHPLLLLVARAVLAVDVAHVMTVVAVRLALEEGGPVAAPRALD